MTLPHPDAPLRVSRTPAKVKQADIARAARVAKRLGDGWAVEIAPDGTIRIVQHGGAVESRGIVRLTDLNKRGGRFPDARRRPPYLLKGSIRHGKTVWYVRKADGPRTRIKGDYGSPEFMAEYEAAIHGEASKPPQKAKDAQGSLAWLDRALSRFRRMGGALHGDATPARKHL